MRQTDMHGDLRNRNCRSGGSIGCANKVALSFFLLQASLAALLGTLPGNTVAQGAADAAVDTAAYLRQAEAGDIAAQAYIGYLYYKGEHLPQDYALAQRWLQAAALHGSADAQYNLGLVHAHGHGTAPDLQQAAQWYRQAAEQGHAPAQYKLALSYYYGDGQAQDLSQAAHWFDAAARQDHVSAQMHLASMYNIGQGIPQDIAQAAYWYDLAARLGAAQAQYNLGLLYRMGFGVTQDRNRARYWLQQAAAQGYQAAIQELRGARTALAEEAAPDGANPPVSALPGIPADASPAPQEPGQSVPDAVPVARVVPPLEERPAPAAAPQNPGPAAPDPATESPAFPEPAVSLETEALLRFEPLAVRGDARAQEVLGAMYYLGRGVIRDRSIAFHWFRRAAEQSQPQSQYWLGQLYLVGEGVQADPTQARKWYRLAQAQGWEPAQQALEQWDRLDAELLREENLENANQLIEASLHTGLKPSPAPGRQALNQAPGNTATGPETAAFPARISQQATDRSAARQAQLQDARNHYEEGVLYELGAGREQNEALAFQWFLKSARQGYAPAQYKVAIAYTYSHGTEQDLEQATQWYEKAALQGHVIAQRNLGMMYLTNGTAEDRINAYAWFRVVADVGAEPDLRALGNLENQFNPQELEAGRRQAEVLRRILPGR